jgi:2-polyprenyl-3-methyl-5-hydroxy-6-metoxy-1,4-benzoquinol methylase
MRGFGTRKWLDAGASISSPGHYAKKQLLCRSSIIAWSHHSRFSLARTLVEPHAGKRLLDYGCGDGTFLAEVHDLFPISVGTDIDPNQTLDCRARFAQIYGISFLLTSDLADPIHQGAYDVVTCMEVLEHCINEDLEKVLVGLRNLVSSSGVVILSVPIEIGPSLIGKQMLRRYGGWRGLGDYKFTECYTAYELWRMIFAGAHSAICRPVYSNGSAGARFHAHKGFNWRSLREQLHDYFQVKQTLFSPLGWLRGYCSSQAWFLCEPR